jgi:hypothetical protein
LQNTERKMEFMSLTISLSDFNLVNQLNLLTRGQLYKTLNYFIKSFWLAIHQPK